MKELFNNIKLHFPMYAGLTLVVVNALIDAGSLNVPPHLAGLVNAVLAAAGLGVLHVRQQRLK